MSLSAAFGEIGNSLINPDKRDGIITKNDESIFEEEPVDLKTFLYNEKYLNLSITLSLPQEDFIENCSRIFDGTIYTEGVLQCGQGSGKDTCSIFLCLRLVYLLQCLKSPQKYFNMGDLSFIDIINVAPTADLARKIYFDTLKNYLKGSAYFRKLIDIDKDITSKEIIFPKFIRLHSSNSVDEAWQGLTPILIVLDEIDAFKSELELQKSRSLRSEGAEGLYNTATTLVQSRFTGIGKVLCLSWPRFKGSFIQQRFVKGKTERGTYVVCKEDGTPYSTWEFNPARNKEAFKDMYEKDPILARARFECDPPFARDAFIKETYIILRALDASMDEFDEISWSKNKNLRTETMMPKDKRLYIHIDLGKQQSNAALCISHYENDGVYIDLLKTWEPLAGKDIDINELEKFVMDLKNNGYRIESCTYDGYQSLSAMQALEKAGINAYYKSVTRNREAYDTTKDLLFQGRVDGYYDKELVLEMLGLDLVYGDKIEARPGSRKDRADALVGSIHGTLKGEETKRQIKSVAEVGSMFSNPIKVDDNGMAVQEFVEKNTRPQPKFASAKVNEKGLISSGTACEDCKRDGGMEFSGPEGRILDEEGAKNKWCIVCHASWDRVGVDDSWIQRNESDPNLLTMLRG